MMNIIPQPITIVLADPREIFREGLEATIRRFSDLSVVASVPTLDQALVSCCSERASILLVGDLLTEHDYSYLSTIFSRLPPKTRSLLICSDADRLAELIELGFWGCLQQTATGAEVLRAVRAVARGEYWAPRRLLTQMLRDRLNGSTYHSLTESQGHSGLTRREAEILELVALGYSNEQIAATLFIGRSTVKTHLLRTFRKLEAVDRTSAVTIALGRNLIRTSGDSAEAGGEVAPVRRSDAEDEELLK